MPDPVSHPAHYTSHPSGVECLTVVRHMGFNLGNAVKYIWRAGLKGDALEDLQKAAFYIADEIARIKAATARGDEDKISIEVAAEILDKLRDGFGFDDIEAMGIATAAAARNLTRTLEAEGFEAAK